ncbi:DNA-methyltransferase [Streptodolium elevatio]|uniref:Methyltransferase n=1 Tax=Streptodolium elevatio TaxID=3157996 RepID=A0ABV3D8V7_9ACTN
MITPWYADDAVTLYAGDAASVLRTLAPASAACVVTSPPYWGLRDYGTGHWIGGDPMCQHPHNRAAADRCGQCGAVRQDGQYGREASPEGYVDHVREVFRQLVRVLEPTGTVWLNLGDSYSASPPGRTSAPMRASGLQGRESALRLRESVRRARIDRTGAVPRKNLLGMPWRTAFALQDDGWILRNAIVWHKPNAMPESVRDRLSCRYEMLFLLVRQERYFFDLDPIREPLARPEALGKGAIIGGRHKGAHAGVGATARRRGSSSYGDAKYDDDAAFAAGLPGTALLPTGRRHDATHARGKNPGDVWRISTRPLRAAHFAPFPVDLPLRCIAAGCRPGGVVLDPFSGSATTGLAARQLGHPYVGIDLNPDFHTIGLARLRLTSAGRDGIEPSQERSA